MTTKLDYTLNAVSKEFQTWRSQKQSKQERIPQNLWIKAIALSSCYPPRKVAQKLGLNLRDLKKRILDSGDPPSAPSMAPKKLPPLTSPLEPSPSEPSFIEAQMPLSSFPSLSSCESVEFIREDGTRMRLYASPDRPFDPQVLMNHFLEGGHAANHSTN